MMSGSDLMEQRPALSFPVKLGQFYDGSKFSFLPDLAWNKDLLASVGSKCTQINTLREFINKDGWPAGLIELELQVAIQCGLLDPRGHNLFGAKKWRPLEGIIIQSRSEILNFNQLTLDTETYDRAVTGGATHVVIGIEYGKRVVFNAQVFNNNDEPIADQLSRIRNTDDAAAVPVLRDGDFAAEECQIKNLQEARDFMAKLRDDFKANRLLGVPTSVYLLPLHSLKSGCDRMTRKIGDQTLEACRAIFEHLDDVCERATDLLSTCAVRLNNEILKEMQAFIKAIREYRAQFADQVKTLLVQAKRIGADDEALMKWCKAREETPFARKLLDSWLATKRREFAVLENVEPRSVELTREVLEKEIEILSQCINQGLSELTKMRNLVLVVEELFAREASDKNYRRRVKVLKTRRVHFTNTPTSQRFVTNCMVCSTTCHDPCQIPNDEDKAGCAAMERSGAKIGNCRVCKNKCHWSKHVNRDFVFENYEDEEEVTVDDMKRKYDAAVEGLSAQENVLLGIEQEYDKVQKQVVLSMKKVTDCLNELERIALRKNLLTTVDYVDTLIDITLREKRPGYQSRVMQLQKARERAVLISQVESENFNPLDYDDPKLAAILESARKKKEELTEAEEQLRKLRADAQSAVDGKRAIERDLEASRAELDQIRRELAEFREKHSETVAELDISRREAEEMRRKNAADQERLAMLESQLTSAVNDMKQLVTQKQMEIEQLQGRVAATRAELVDVKRTREEHSQQLAAQAQQLQEQEQILDTTIDEKSSLETILGIREGELREVQDNIDELQRRLAVLANENMNHEARADDLEHQLQEGMRGLGEANEGRENDRQEREEADRQHAEELDGIRTTLNETQQRRPQEHELGDLLCPICQERQRDTVYRPCGHTVCQQCADQWRAQQQTCASCRQSATEILRIYMQ